MGRADRALLPVGIQEFEEIRQRKNIYVDKSRFLCSMAEIDTCPVFISRPRRFGKSLLLSTFQSLFSHGTEYFAGLDIAKSWKDVTYKVVYLDFSTFSNGEHDIEEFDRLFCNHLLSRFAVPSDEDISRCRIPAVLLDRILSRMQRMSLVLLIDEYDSPMTNAMNNAELYKKRVGILNEFYSVLKTYISKCRFMLITGVARYRYASIFSGLNNVVDISMHPDYSTILGYTDEEIDRYFAPYIENAADVFSASAQEIRSGLKTNYYGYCFDWECSSPVYNPWSVIMFLLSPIKSRGYQDFWNESAGTSPIVVKYFRNITKLADSGKYSLALLDRRLSGQIPVDVNDLYLRADSPSELNPEVLLLQTGYFTFRGIDGDDALISVPNDEVRSSLRRLFFFCNNQKR